MNSVITNIALMVTLLFPLQAMAAVKIVECQDDDGNRTFQKTCPPGTTEVGAKQFSTGSGSAGAGAGQSVNIQATLYVIPDCEACEEVKEFLGSRNIPVTEKNVSDDIQLQNELTELTGALQVPTTVIGEEILTGYSRSNFLQALKKAGYEEDS